MCEVKNTNLTEISLGGEKREIASYDFIMKNQMVNHETEIMTPFQYQTCLFNNMGFTKCPENSYWIKQGTDMELVGQTEVFDQPMSSVPVIILGEKPRLSFMMDLINVWCHGETKSGHLIDPEKSFSNKRDYEFCIKNNLQMKIGYTIQQEEYSWNSADLYTERLHQLNPIVGKNYFENCLSNFDAISKVTFIDYPYVMFAMAVINPDMVMSVIMQAECTTAMMINSGEFHGINNMAAMSPNTLPEFQYQLNYKLSLLNQLYSKYGIRGLIILNRLYLRDDRISKDYIANESIKEKNMYGKDLLEKDRYQAMFDNGETEMFDSMKTGEDKENYVLTIETNRKSQYGEEDIQNIAHYENRIKEIVFRYVNDENSFPEKINMENRGINSYEYKKVLLKLYILIEYILTPKYSKVLGGSKLILSNNFYVDEKNFALYIPSMNIYMYVDPDYNIDFMTPNEIVKYYDNTFGGKHFIDPEEVDSASELGKIKELHIPENFDLIMSTDKYYQTGKDEVNLDIQPVVQQQAQQPIQPQVQTQQPQVVITNMVPDGYNEPRIALDPASLVIN